MPPCWRRSLQHRIHERLEGALLLRSLKLRVGIVLELRGSSPTIASSLTVTVCEPGIWLITAHVSGKYSLITSRKRNAGSTPTAPAEGRYLVDRQLALAALDHRDHVRPVVAHFSRNLGLGPPTCSDLRGDVFGYRGSRLHVLPKLLSSGFQQLFRAHLPRFLPPESPLYISGENRKHPSKAEDIEEMSRILTCVRLSPR